MAKVYFHLNDEDVINILTNEAVEIPKPEPKKPKICQICNEQNNEENLFCWKCGNIFSNDDKNRVAIEIISQPHEIQKLRKENEELKHKLVSMKQLYKEEIKEFTLNELKSMFEDLYYRKKLRRGSKEEKLLKKKQELNTLILIKI
ncbi:MAG: hypothetical protein ACFFBK_02520 [Promethearchaeota archaeon]